MRQGHWLGKGCSALGVWHRCCWLREAGMACMHVGSAVQVPQLWCLVYDRRRRVREHCCESAGLGKPDLTGIPLCPCGTP